MMSVSGDTPVLRHLYSGWRYCLRISGTLFLAILMAVGYMLYLTGRDATSSLDAVAVVATDLREAGVTGRSLDRYLALQMINAMDGLLETPETIPDHINFRNTKDVLYHIV